MLHLLYITPTIKFLDEFIKLNGATCPEYQHGPLVVPYMSSISHNNAVMNTFNDEPIFEDSFLNDDEGGVGGLNHTLSLVKPLVIVTMFLVPKSYVTFVVNVNSNLGIQF